LKKLHDSARLALPPAQFFPASWQWYLERLENSDNSLLVGFQGSISGSAEGSSGGEEILTKEVNNDHSGNFASFHRSPHDYLKHQLGVN
jgi:hypothetical protein